MNRWSNTRCFRNSYSCMTRIDSVCALKTMDVHSNLTIPLLIPMGGFGVKSHEKIGADFLREKGFSERIASLVENHVQAKRYLTFKYPNYYQQLSEASKKTLEFQGGVMNAYEADAFQQDPLFETSILMRKWDELAKETNLPLIPLDQLKMKAQKILHHTNRKSSIVY